MGFAYQAFAPFIRSMLQLSPCPLKACAGWSTWMSFKKKNRYIFYREIGFIFFCKHSRFKMCVLT